MGRWKKPRTDPDQRVPHSISAAVTQERERQDAARSGPAPGSSAVLMHMCFWGAALESQLPRAERLQGREGTGAEGGSSGQTQFSVSLSTSPLQERGRMEQGSGPAHVSSHVPMTHRDGVGRSRLAGQRWGLLPPFWLCSTEHRCCSPGWDRPPLKHLFSPPQLAAALWPSAEVLQAPPHLAAQACTHGAGPGGRDSPGAGGGQEEPVSSPWKPRPAWSPLRIALPLAEGLGPSLHLPEMDHVVPGGQTGTGGD